MFRARGLIVFVMGILTVILGPLAEMAHSSLGFTPQNPPETREKSAPDEKGKSVVPPKTKKDKSPSIPFEPINPIGMFRKADQNQPARILVWFENGIWNISATSKINDKDRTVRFDGAVEVIGGRILDGDLTGLEPPKLKVNKKGQVKGQKTPPGMDYLRMMPLNRGFQFQFHNRGRIDQVKFRVSPGATAIRFVDLRIAGGDLSDRIFIGEAGLHPRGSSFFLPASPNR